MSHRKGENKRKIWTAVMIVALIGIVVLLGTVAFRLYQDWKAEQAYKDAQEQIEEPEFTGEREGDEAELPDDIFRDMGNPINFKKLQKINKELYAWIRVPDTKIDYPVGQNKENSFYLNHDMYKEPRFAGCIYTEKANSKDFEDPNTVLYGHNMIGGTMFSNLHNFRDQEFFDKHPYFYIYTPDYIMVYQVFAAYTYDDRHILNSFDFSKEEVFAEYIEDIFNVRSMDRHLREDVEVTTDDKIVTLSTCIGNETNKRYLVQGKRIWKGTEDEVPKTMDTGTEKNE